MSDTSSILQGIAFGLMKCFLYQDLSDKCLPVTFFQQWLLMIKGSRNYCITTTSFISLSVYVIHSGSTLAIVELHCICFVSLRDISRADNFQSV